MFICYQNSLPPKILCEIAAVVFLKTVFKETNSLSHTDFQTNINFTDFKYKKANIQFLGLVAFADNRVFRMGFGSSFMSFPKKKEDLSIRLIQINKKK